MPDPLLYLTAMCVAAIVSVLSVVTMVAGSRVAGSTWLNSASVVGIGLGFAAGYSWMSLQPVWPPAGSLDRLLALVIPVALGIELIAGLRIVPNWTVWLCRVCFAVAVPRILLHGSVYLSSTNSDWSAFQAVGVLLLSGAMLAGVWSLLAELNSRKPGVSISLALCLTLLCAGATIMMAGYIKGGAAAFPLVAVVAAVALTTAALPGKIYEKSGFRGESDLGIAIVGLFGLLFVGRFFGRLSTCSALAMLFAPVLCWITELPYLRRRSLWTIGMLRLLLVSIPLLIILTNAKRAFDRDMTPLLSRELNIRSLPQPPIESLSPIESQPLPFLRVGLTRRLFRDRFLVK